MEVLVYGLKDLKRFVLVSCRANGLIVDIAGRIAKETGRVLKLAILGFANDYLDASMPVETPWGEVPDIPLLTELKKMKKRIFQEVFMLDKRLVEALAIMNV